ncbi:cutinase family protein [Nocardioides sp. SYSU D00038]|uniref:cutinase family protein n=1 Tax=Nocardioides sp. SYSU D00038 TaxID=2812554 RepID=UPI0019672260|nr:cutinase family protein [Nocardioides sp. SYSU D00038]
MSRRVWSILASAGVTVTLAATALSVVAQGDADPAGSAEPAAGSAAARGDARTVARVTRCADVLVIGIDGNGERPGRKTTFGPTVEAVSARYLAKARAAGRTTSTQRLPRWSTPGLGTLVKGRRATADVAAGLRRSSINAWKKPIAAGVDTASRAVGAAVAACPERQVVLVGYAQGAAVAHRTAARLAARGDVAQLTAVVLVSDPDRRGGSVTPLDGNPAAPRSSRGLLNRRSTAQPDLPPARGTFAAWSVCTKRDLVCAPGRTSLARARSVAASYARKNAAGARVRSGLLAHTRLRPVPKPATQVYNARQKEPLAIQLAADVAPRARAGVRWQVVGGEPAGIDLSSTGRVSGTPTGTGTWNLTYQVRGTTPPTPARTGVLVISVQAEAVSISAGGQASCETRSDKTAWCWGRNDYGQLGDGSTTHRPQPTRVQQSKWVDISTSGSSTCGIKDNGQLYCWGLNNYGQIGSAKSGPVKSPKRVGTASDWRDVSASWFHACATKNDGSLWCWGQNLRGQLGIGRTERHRAVPVRVGTARDWTGVVASGWHTCGTRRDGSAWCWGENTLGQLGDGTVTRRTAPARVLGGGWRQLSTAWGHTCGIRVSGELACWGFNQRGQLGNGTTTSSRSPVTVAPGRVWTGVSAGDDSTCALDNTGRPWCWGDNRYGEVGGPIGHSTTPVARSERALTAISAGWLHHCGSAPGRATCWGSNELGQLGNAVRVGGSTARLAPVAFKRNTETDAQLARMAPGEIVERQLGDRPAVPAAAKKVTGYHFRIMTFNVLGSQHTSPSGGRSDWAPGRIRAEWSSELIGAKTPSLIGTQELQPDQVLALNEATSGTFSFFPGNTLGYSGAPQSVMWRNSMWQATYKSTISIPFMDGYRPQPVVRLRHKPSGGQVYLINVHFSPGKMEADRDRATNIVIKTIQKLAKDKLPIMLTGDFNEREELFCKVVRRTDLVAGLGGSFKNGKCTPPAGRRVDWIFGSKGVFNGFRIDQGATVRRITDHSVHASRFAVR